MSSEIQDRADELRAIAAKPLEHFPLDRDPLTGERLEPVYRLAIPVYCAETHEIREWLP